MYTLDRALDYVGRWIARRVDCPCDTYFPETFSALEAVTSVIRPGDVLLVEGTSSVATAIKYLTQSSWSHAALYVGDRPQSRNGESKKSEGFLVEANLGEGTVIAPLSKYSCSNTRICRPTRLSHQDLDDVITFAIARVGAMYDTRHILDLARYLFPTPPVPVRWRRRMIALGAGEPTRYICSNLIAQAFASVGQPIKAHLGSSGSSISNGFSEVAADTSVIAAAPFYTPRDFDLSPYFEIVKPPASCAIFATR